MITQIYEVTSPHEARAISALGVDNVGVKVGDGSYPRELSFSTAAAIAAAILAPAKFTALFLSPDPAYIAKGVQFLRPAILHLGASPELLSVEDVAALRVRLPSLAVMRSIPVTDETSIALAKSYEGAADFLLLDSKKGDRMGALGVTHDWTVSRRIVESVRVPIILAGGLGPDNVKDAIRQVRPAGVDSKTRTDLGATHTKDLDKVRAFHESAKSAAKEESSGRKP